MRQLRLRFLTLGKKSTSQGVSLTRNRRSRLSVEFLERRDLLAGVLTGVAYEIDAVTGTDYDGLPYIWSYGTPVNLTTASGSLPISYDEEFPPGYATMNGTVNFTFPQTVTPGQTASISASAQATWNNSGLGFGRPTSIDIGDGIGPDGLDDKGSFANGSTSAQVNWSDSVAVPTGRGSITLPTVAVVVDGKEDKIISLTASYQIPQAPTVMSLVANQGPTPSNQMVTFVASVVPQQAGGPTPTGSVSFTVDGGSPLVVAVGGTGTASFTPGPLTAGMHTITAAYQGDPTYAASGPVSVTQFITGTMPTTLTLNPQQGPVPPGTPLSFYAFVSTSDPMAPTLTGAVVFTIAGGQTFTTPIAKNSTGDYEADFSPTGSLAAGTYTVTATYSGDNNFAPSANSNTQVITGNTKTSLTLSPSPGPTPSGQNVTFVASVVPMLSGGGTSVPTTPTGKVAFSVDTGFAPDLVTLVGGMASFTTGYFLKPGMHTITATYEGDPTYAASGPVSVTQFITGTMPTTLTLNPQQGPVPPGTPLSFYAFVSTSDPMAPTLTGAVVFTIAGGQTFTTPIAKNSTGDYEADFSPTGSLAAGTYTVTATYSGDNNFAPSANSNTQVITGNTETSLTLSPSPGPTPSGQNVTFVASVVPMLSGGGTSVPTTPTGKVAFSVDTGFAPDLVTLVGGMASFTTGYFLKPGMHTITATYEGDPTYAASGPVSVTQFITGTRPTTLTLNPPQGPVPPGTPLAFYAFVSTSDPMAPTLTGAVVFTIAGGQTFTTPIAKNSTGDYEADFSPTGSLAAGTYTVTATYSGDNNFAPSANSNTQVITGNTKTSLTLAPSQGPTPSGQNVTFVASVVPMLSGGGTSVPTTPTGKVAFSVDTGFAPDLVTLVGGMASFTTGYFLKPGMHTITATYEGDPTYAASGPVSVTQVITSPPPPVEKSTPELTKKGLTSVNVSFDESLEAASAEDSSDYHVFGAVTKVVKHRRKTVYTKPIKIKSVTYSSSSNTANVKLAKPVKGKVEIKVSGTFTTTSGTEETVNYTDEL